jgi:hypothetical protein
MCRECATFKQIAEQASARESEAYRQLEDAERDLRVLRAARTRLENQIEREHGESAEASVVGEIIEYYAITTGHTKTKVTPIGANADAIRKAFRMKFTKEELKLAIDGASKYPFIVDYRRSAAGTEKQRFDKITTIFRDENKISDLIKLAEVQPLHNGEASEVPIGTAERWRRENYPMARVLAALWDIDAPLTSPTPDTWTTSCPVHFGPGLIARRSEDGLMNVECVNGCDFWRLLAALHLEPAELFENAEQDPSRASAGERSIPAHLQEAAGLLQARLSGMA